MPSPAPAVNSNVISADFLKEALGRSEPAPQMQLGVPQAAPVVRQSFEAMPGQPGQP